MQLAEYEALEKVEREHWFYKGKRLLVRWWIERAAKLAPGDRIVDAGAGTGELVRELSGIYERRGISVVGIEYSEEGRRLAHERKGTELLDGSILDLPLQDSSCAVMIALDVLEHVEDDARAFSEMLRVTKPGGLIIINVPAFMSLWSDWDISLGHFRRYTKQMFKTRVTRESDPSPFEILFFDHTNVFAFPAIWLYRKLAHIIKIQSRAEDKIPSPRLNALLMKLFVGPSKALWFHPPFGVSLFVVLRKK